MGLQELDEWDARMWLRPDLLPPFAGHVTQIFREWAPSVRQLMVAEVSGRPMEEILYQPTAIGLAQRSLKIFRTTVRQALKDMGQGTGRPVEETDEVLDRAREICAREHPGERFFLDSEGNLNGAFAWKAALPKYYDRLCPQVVRGYVCGNWRCQYDHIEGNFRTQHKWQTMHLDGDRYGRTRDGNRESILKEKPGIHDTGQSRLREGDDPVTWFARFEHGLRFNAMGVHPFSATVTRWGILGTMVEVKWKLYDIYICLLYTSPSPRD